MKETSGLLKNKGGSIALLRIILLFFLAFSLMKTSPFFSFLTGDYPEVTVMRSRTYTLVLLVAVSATECFSLTIFCLDFIVSTM
ncbi:hypothetical protein EDC96DRAFT_491172 [Choanephora cucurbitarum]|nr:hypothetical protein EDC96DRAFT_491172 [Choanephora cucurbitarum]